MISNKYIICNYIFLNTYWHKIFDHIQMWQRVDFYRFVRCWINATIGKGSINMVSYAERGLIHPAAYIYNNYTYHMQAKVF